MPAFGREPRDFAREVLASAGLMAEPIPDAFWADLKAEKLLRADAPTPPASP